MEKFHFSFNIRSLFDRILVKMLKINAHRRNVDSILFSHPIKAIIIFNINDMLFLHFLKMSVNYKCVWVICKANTIMKVKVLFF